MATINDKFPSLLDLAKDLDPDGKPARTINLLSQTNEILLDMVTLQGNLTTGHRTTMLTGLPSAIFRKLYQGVPSSKATRVQVDDACGMLTTRSQVDKKLVELAGNPDVFRMSQASPFLEAMNQTMATYLFYGDTDTEAEAFTGLSPRYSSLSANNTQNIIDAGGTGSDNTSIWLIYWGENTVHGIFPKNTVAGIRHEDYGEIDALDSNNNPYRVLAEAWNWDIGISVPDWRYAVRIANIDVSNLVAESNAANLVKLMIKALHRIPSKGMGRPAFYCNRTVAEMLDIQSLNTTQYTLKSGNDVYGNEVTMCRGIPIRTCDAITETETRVV